MDLAVGFRGFVSLVHFQRSQVLVLEVPLDLVFLVIGYFVHVFKVV